MILQVSSSAPVVLQAAASAILFAHIGGAFVGLISGGAAMVLRKGGPLHRAIGSVFSLAMLTMAGVGAAVAPFLPQDQLPNTVAGVLTFYLVATAWMTVRRGPGQTGRFEAVALLAPLGVAASGAWLIWRNAVAAHPVGGPETDGAFVFAIVGALAAAADLSVILRGGVSGAARLSRHLWRMSAALLIAAGSFAGQPRAIPHFLQGSPLVFLPALATLGLMIFWLVRVRLPKRRTAGPVVVRVSRATRALGPDAAASRS
jgi:uncharacterized membrane protein